MKPKIGDEVYVIIDAQIIKYAVGYLGAETFIVDEYPYIIVGEFYYDAYNSVWFKDLEKAKKQLRKKYGRKIVIKPFGKDMWEVYEEDD